ncbi:hypothetical protein [Streptomyces kaniharaensis]|uniref:hypothetical protein n=1 Tax=Streptomyces kaniharaensis TaxID=212423 RepID=UPI001294CD51|nr:hypothetical protein [Streptomyces kaniharaensis]
MRELFEGVSLAAFARGNRRIIAAVKARSTVAEPDPCKHPDHKKPAHAEHCASHPAPKATPADTEQTEHPFVTWAKRIGGAAGVLVLLWPMVGKWVPTVGAGTVTLWVLAALVMGQEQAADDSAEKAGPAATADSSPEADDQEDDEIQDAPPAATLYALIRHVAGLSDQGTAAHLSQVIEEGEKRSLLGGWEVADLSDHLGSLGVPVVEKKKLHFSGRQRVRSAVLLAALPQADPAAVPAVSSGAA